MSLFVSLFACLCSTAATDIDELKRYTMDQRRRRRRRVVVSVLVIRFSEY